MDTLVGYAVVGVAASGGAGFLLARDLLAAHRRRRRAREALGSAVGGWPGALAWRLKNGVAPLRPMAEALLRRPSVRRYAVWGREALGERGLAVSTTALLTVVLFASVLLVGVGWLAAGSPVFGLAVAGCALVAAGGFAKGDAERRACALRDEIPDALRSLGVCFRAGLSLMQTLRQTGSEMKGPLGEVFLSSARLLETGGTASEALAVFRRGGNASELAFAAVALDVQHASGGSLAHVLDAARESVEGEIELERSLRVQTAQAKLSARIVTVMPFVLVALFSLMSPGFLTPFFESVPGMLLLACALAMQVAGVMAVHRLLNVDGG